MWSAELQEQTRAFLKTMNGAFMKHYGDFIFGICIKKEGKYIILNRDCVKNKRWEYASLKEMINDGWAID